MARQDEVVLAADGALLVALEPIELDAAQAVVVGLRGEAVFVTQGEVRISIPLASAADADIVSKSLSDNAEIVVVVAGEQGVVFFDHVVKAPPEPLHV